MKGEQRGAPAGYPQTQRDRRQEKGLRDKAAERDPRTGCKFRTARCAQKLGDASDRMPRDSGVEGGREAGSEVGRGTGQGCRGDRDQNVKWFSLGGGDQAGEKPGPGHWREHGGAAELRGCAETRRRARKRPRCASRLSASAPRRVQPCVRPGGMPGSGQLQRPRPAPRKLSPSDLGEREENSSIPWVLSRVPRAPPRKDSALQSRSCGLAPTVLKPVGTLSPFENLVIAVGSLSRKKCTKCVFCTHIHGAQGLQVTRLPILNKLFLTSRERKACSPLPGRPRKD